eukprot:1840448-Pleurochrysis_carterae.AAC.1
MQTAHYAVEGDGHARVTRRTLQGWHYLCLTDSGGFLRWVHVRGCVDEQIARARYTDAVAVATLRVKPAGPFAHGALHRAHCVRASGVGGCAGVSQPVARRRGDAITRCNNSRDRKIKHIAENCLECSHRGRADPYIPY